jgi:phosphopantothenoylcysteine synthetase/decarboxylase
VLYVVVCAAPPALHVGDLVGRAQDLGWVVRAVPTPSAADWVDTGELARLTGQPVPTRSRRPGEPRPVPADAVAVAPATFNTVNKWAAGVSDNPALGVLNEVLGLRLPVVVAPHAKDALAAHPAFGRSLRLLADCGVTVLPANAVQPGGASGAVDWSPVLDALPDPARTR